MQKRYIFFILPFFLFGCGIQQSQTISTSSTWDDEQIPMEELLTWDFSGDTNSAWQEQFSWDSMGTWENILTWNTENKTKINTQEEDINTMESVKVKQDKIYKQEWWKLYYNDSLDPKHWKLVDKILNSFDYIWDWEKLDLKNTKPVDIDSFQEIWLGMAKDKNWVFYCGWNCLDGGCYRIKWADAATFELVNNTYAKDKSHIYNIWCMWACSGMPVMTGFDVKATDILGSYYLWSKNKIYYCGQEISWINEKNFKFVESNPTRYISNGKDLYVWNFRLEGVDFDTLEIEENYYNQEYDFKDKNYKYKIDSSFFQIDDVTKTPIKK